MATATGLGARLASAGASLLTVPLLLGYLGVDSYGLWVTAGAYAAWVGLAGLGLGPSLLSHLAVYGRDEHAARSAVFASAWWMSLALGGALLMGIVLLDLLGIWASLVNSPSDPLAADARAFMVAMCVGAAAGLPLGLPLVVLRAEQAGYWANALEVAGTVLRLGAIVAVIAADLGPAALVIAAVGMPLLVHAGALLMLPARDVRLPSPSLASRSEGRALLRTGAAFLGLAAAALVISSTDVIVIAQAIGPEAVPTYSVAFSLLAIFVSLEMVALDSVWPAYSEAAARHDRAWIQRTHTRLTRVFIAASVAFAVVLAVAGQTIIRVWAGEAAVPPVSLLVVLGLIACTQAVLLPHGRLLTALGQVRRNTVLGMAGAAVNLPLTIVLVNAIGVPGAALGTLIAYLLTGMLLVRDANGAMRQITPATARAG
jgi:O-antigen/teichoic acid export membrane protein